VDQREQLSFNEKLLPYGEDEVTYEYKSGSLFVRIFYNEFEDVIDLVFPGCSYHYFAPVPGYYPFEIGRWKGFPEAGCIYENFGSELLENRDRIFEQNSNIPMKERHFSFYLEWANISMDIIADGFECKYSKTKA